jgi:Domain of unknown function (DUF4148)
MKSLIQAVVVAAVLAVPVVSFAQSNQPLTRAQVKAELVQIEAAGYNPATANDYDYPGNIQAAEARVAAQKAATTGYGGVSNGSSDSGSSIRNATGNSVRSVYMGQ